MKYSNFGQKFSGKSGIVELMDDLGSALNENPDMLFMGGGNPGRVPEVEAYFEKKLALFPLNTPNSAISPFTFEANLKISY